MSDQPRFPFLLENTAFLRLEFRRRGSLPEPLQTVWSATVRVEDSRAPRFDVFVVVEASADQPFSFTVEVVGTFNIAPDDDPPDNATFMQFLTEQGLFMLWPYVVQAVAHSSSQMGMPIVKIDTPIQWKLGTAPET